MHSCVCRDSTPNLIDLTEFSGYNDFKVIYLLGMAVTFPDDAQKEDMAVDTEIKNAVSAADTEAQYDDKAKRLLSNKIILAHILIKTVDEFRGMSPKDVVPYIEGEPFVSVVPVEPGLTNAEIIPSGDGLKGGQRIVGINTENAEVNEGLIRFDIIFYVRMKDGISQVIVNLDYSDFRLIPINLFWGLYFSPFRYIYRNKFFSSL